MSDYEVTLVNDNSRFHLFGRWSVPLLWQSYDSLANRLIAHSVSQPSPNDRCPLDCLPCSRLDIRNIPLTHWKNRQEFYVKFTGPTESE